MTSWAPDEPPAAIWLEKLILAGASVGNIAYGVHLTLFFMSFVAWWGHRRRTPRATYMMLAFISCIFILGTIGNAVQMRLIQLSFIDYRNYPGGPGAFDELDGSIRVNVVGTAAYSVNEWFVGGLLLYRLYVVWFNSSWQRWIMVPALLTLVLSIISGSILLAQIADPGGTIWISSSANMALTFWGSAIAVTVYCTIFIVARLLFIQRQVRKVLGSDDQVSYFSVVTMVIESAAIYTVFAFAFLVTYAIGDPSSTFLVEVQGQMQSIAPLMIVLRVAQGRAWTVAKAQQTQELVAASHGSLVFRYIDSSRRTANMSMPTTGRYELRDVELADHTDVTPPSKPAMVVLEDDVEALTHFPADQV